MTERIDMQEPLDDRQLTRDFWNNYHFFRVHGKFDLEREVLTRLQEEDIIVLDAGCGSGTGIEHLVRHLGAFAQRQSYKGKLTGIGIDLNPLPELIPSTIQGLYPGENVNDIGIIADLKKGDVCDMPLEDNSVSVGYSTATLIYVLDTLKALAEGYRVLKQEGAFIWEICEKELSHKPTFTQILEETPGAKEVFTYVKSTDVADTGFVICRKSETDTFKGFNYKVIGEAQLHDVKPGSLRSFYRNAIYEKA
jgi:ubiquinone/menaquinone biosynthesis C-methylase UbiE